MCTVCALRGRTYFALAADVSPVSGPGLLVQAVGDSEECDVVVPQP